MEEFEIGLERVKIFIESVVWTTSKDKSHQWIFRDGDRHNAKIDIEEFQFFVMFIREFGYKEHYFRAIHTYINIGKYKYWTMGAALNITTIINRQIYEQNLELRK